MFCHFLFMCEGTGCLTGRLSAPAMPFVSCSLALGVCFSISTHKSPYKNTVVTDPSPTLKTSPTTARHTLCCDIGTCYALLNILFLKGCCSAQFSSRYVKAAQNIPLENQAWNHYLGILRIISHWTSHSSGSSASFFFFSISLLLNLL